MAKKIATISTVVSKVPQDGKPGAPGTPGSPGASAVAYSLVCSPTAVRRYINGVSPASVTVAVYKTVGSAISPTAEGTLSAVRHLTNGSSETANNIAHTSGVASIPVGATTDRMELSLVVGGKTVARQTVAVNDVVAVNSNNALTVGSAVITPAIWDVKYLVRTVVWTAVPTTDNPNTYADMDTVPVTEKGAPYTMTLENGTKVMRVSAMVEEIKGAESRMLTEAQLTALGMSLRYSVKYGKGDGTLLAAPKDEAMQYGYLYNEHTPTCGMPLFAAFTVELIRTQTVNNKTETTVVAGKSITPRPMIVNRARPVMVIDGATLDFRVLVASMLNDMLRPTSDNKLNIHMYDTDGTVRDCADLQVALTARNTSPNTCPTWGNSGSKVNPGAFESVSGLSTTVS